MKFIKIFFLGLLLTGCQTYKKIGNLPMELKLDRSTVITVLSEDSEAYKRGWRAVIKSMNSDEFLSNLQTNKIEGYFDFMIKEPIVWQGSIEEWTKNECVTGFVKWERASLVDHYTVAEIETCIPPREYLLKRNGELFVIWEGDDSRDHEKVWEILSNAKFTK